MADIVRVHEDKCLVNIKADCDYILGIGNRQTMDFIDCKVLPQKLFIVGKLDYQWNIKSILQQAVDLFTAHYLISFYQRGKVQ